MTDHTTDIERAVSPTTLSRISERHLSTIYRDIRSGAIRAVRIGRSVRIPQDEVRRYLAGRPYCESAEPTAAEAAR